MLEDLQPCRHCAGRPEVFGSRLEVVIACIDCGMPTPPSPIETIREPAIARLKLTWNAQPDGPATQAHELEPLARRELNCADIALLLSLLDCNDADWETRGPHFAAMAAQLSDVALTPPAFSEIPSVLADASPVPQASPARQDRRDRRPPVGEYPDGRWVGRRNR